MTTVLVTGGAGFMGSHFVRHLLNAYPKMVVLNVDALTYAGNLENLRDVETNPMYRFIHGDITDEKSVDKVFKEYSPCVVFNFAAETHVDRSILGPKHFILTDVLGTYTLLEAAKKYGVDRYIQISTDEVYGSIKKGNFTEESPFKPSSPYSASKAGGDHLARAYHLTYGLPVIQTHSCNVFGPNQFPEKFIPRSITNLLENKPVFLYGNGENIREWIYVSDYCRGLALIFEKGQIGEVYHIGTAWEKTNQEVAKSLVEAFGLNESAIQMVKDRPGHDFRYALDTSRLRKMGFSPLKTFDERLIETVEWYKNNINWWKPLKTNS